MGLADHSEKLCKLKLSKRVYQVSMSFSIYARELCMAPLCTNPTSVSNSYTINTRLSTQLTERLLAFNTKHLKSKPP